MYIGRFLVVGPEFGAYRVSSRSFPNRKITERDDALTVGPTDDAPETDNPYVSYNCLREVDAPAGTRVVFGNGSHVDPIAEKLELGYPSRDALATSLLALDYEKDDYDTPRIAAVLGVDGRALVGTVRPDALLVETVTEPTLVATYEKDAPETVEFPTPGNASVSGSSEPSSSPDATAIARAAYDLDFEHAVCAAGVVRSDEEFDTAFYNGS